MAERFKLGGKDIYIDGEGEIFVNSKPTGILQWKNSPTNYSNLEVQELKDLRGMSIEQVLKFKGYINA